VDHTNNSFSNPLRLYGAAIRFHDFLRVKGCEEWPPWVVPLVCRRSLAYCNIAGAESCVAIVLRASIVCENRSIIRTVTVRMCPALSNYLSVRRRRMIIVGAVNSYDLASIIFYCILPHMPIIVELV
jgi:hypothetical protein